MGVVLLVVQDLLTGILGNISLARIYTDPDKVAERLMEAEKASLRAKDLTQKLFTFASGGAPVMKSSSIARVLRGSAASALDDSDVGCEFSIPEGIWRWKLTKGR